MTSIEKLLLTSKTVFTLDEMAYIWNLSNTSILIDKVSKLVKAKKLIRIRRGFYQVRGRDCDPLELGNKFRTPSYISFSTVLLQEGVVFQYSEEIYLASRDSRCVEVGDYTFVYRKLKDEILFNQSGIINKGNYMIADKERAFLDTLYLEPDFYFDNLRSINFDKCQIYSLIYKNKNLIKKIKDLQKQQIDHD